MPLPFSKNSLHMHILSIKCTHDVLSTRGKEPTKILTNQVLVLTGYDQTETVIAGSNVWPISGYCLSIGYIKRDVLFTIETGHSADFCCQALLQLEILVTLTRSHCTRHLHTKIRSMLLRTLQNYSKSIFWCRNYHYEMNRITCF